MRINTAIRLLMLSQGVKQTKMAHMCGQKRQSNIGSKLKSNNMTFNSAMDLLDVLGYEIIIREVGKGIRRSDEIVITRDDSDIS